MFLYKSMYISIYNDDIYIYTHIMYDIYIHYALMVHQ